MAAGHVGTATFYVHVPETRCDLLVRKAPCPAFDKVYTRVWSSRVKSPPTARTSPAISSQRLRRLHQPREKAGSDGGGVIVEVERGVMQAGSRAGA